MSLASAVGNLESTLEAARLRADRLEALLYQADDLITYLRSWDDTYDPEADERVTKFQEAVRKVRFEDHAV